MHSSIFRVLIVLAVLGVQPLSSVQATERLVSLNYCYDFLLQRWAHDHQELLASTDIGRRLEHVFAFNPDLVLANRFNNPDSIRLLRARGMQVEILDEPSTLVGVLELWQQVATLLGEPEQAQKDIATLEALLASALSARLVERSRGSFIAYQANQWAWGGGSLLSELMSALGFENLADSTQVLVRLTPEHIIAMKPDWLLLEGSEGSFALAHISQWHAGLKQDHVRVVQLSPEITGCLAQRLAEMVPKLEELLGG